jgi:hypothetical protein
MQENREIFHCRVGRCFQPDPLDEFTASFRCCKYPRISHMQLEIKPAHKPIKQYYTALAEFEKYGATKETSVQAAFQEILTTYARRKKWSFIAEEGITLANGNAGSVDGAIKDVWGVIIGYWEAKDVNFITKARRYYNLVYSNTWAS